MVLAAFVAAGGGCKVNSEDVAYWKRTVKGPTKLTAVLGSSRYSDQLRTEAALALVEMERTDVSGLTLLKDAFTQLSVSDGETAAKVVDGMAPRLETLMFTKQEEDGPPAQEQVRAKDAAYMIIPYASDTTRQQLTKAVVGWYAEDFTGRSLAGDYSAEQVTRALGSPAASMLVNALHAQMPQQALVKIAEIIGRGASEDAKRQAAERLVSIEKEMEAPAFLDWLKKEIRQSLSSQGQDSNENRVVAAALLNRENFINQGSIPAMKYLADQRVVADRLLRIADTKPGSSDPAAWAERLNARRTTALQALEGYVTRAHLQRLLAIALDSSNPTSVRDYAFDRVGDIRSPAAIPRLWPLVQASGCEGTGVCSESDKLAKRLRWRAGEMVLAIGGAGIISEFLKRLPAGASVQYEPEELEGYATRISQMTPPPTGKMRRQLTSPRWWSRVIALRYLERRGQRADISRIKRLSKDSAKVVGEGWKTLDPSVQRVGQVVGPAIKALEARLGSPQPKT